MDDHNAEETLLEALDALYELAEEDPEEALAMFESMPAELRSHPEIRVAEAAVLKASGRIEDAIERLRALLSEAPDDADLHHMMGDALEDAGELEKATEHFLRVWKLDHDRTDLISAELLTQMENTARQTVRELPDEFRQLLRQVPIFIEDRPTAELVRDGLDPRAFGLFDGPTQEEWSGETPPEPPSRIVIYSQNLAAEFSEEDLLEQVAITILHEVGHYFGLDEEDMARLGLE